MSPLTTDPNDPRIKRFTGEPDPKGTPQHDTYLVLPDEELAKGYVRPVRQSYIHVGPDPATTERKGCQGKTTMGLRLAETYARDPKFYGATYCSHCQGHYKVEEFVWAGTKEVVGS